MPTNKSRNQSVATTYPIDLELDAEDQRSIRDDCDVLWIGGILYSVMSLMISQFYTNGESGSQKPTQLGQNHRGSTDQWRGVLSARSLC